MTGRLAAFLSRAASRGFVWGQHDCMLFAADWALELTGQDPAAAWRGTYSDEAGAGAILKAEGGAATIMAQGLQPFGWKHLGSWGRRAGDIVLTLSAAGVVVDDRKVALLTRRGLVFWPVPIDAAWRHG